jgi:hypothetical protein
MSRAALTPSNFDRTISAPGKSPRIIWTLPAIGRRIGTSPDFVRNTLVNVDGSPIREIGGRFYCFEEDLLEFMRSERNKPA